MANIKLEDSSLNQLPDNSEQSQMIGTEALTHSQLGALVDTPTEGMKSGIPQLNSRLSKKIE